MSGRIGAKAMGNTKGERDLQKQMVDVSDNIIFAHLRMHIWR
jgi:hypothetical protein